MGSKRIVNLGNNLKTSPNKSYRKKEAERPASYRACFPSFMHQFYTVIHSVTGNVCMEVNLVLRGELT